MIHSSHPQRNNIILHLTVMVWGFTGVLGALISVDAMQLVWYRVLIASLTLLVYLKVGGGELKTGTRDMIRLISIGAIVGLHWILFFQAIKSSTVSIALVCLSSITLFTAILEPIILKRKIALSEVITGLFIIAGICMIFKFETRYTMGIIYGLSAAITASLFSILNSIEVKKRSAALISFYELTGAFGWLSIAFIILAPPAASFKVSFPDLGYLLLLGVVCTALAYVAAVSVMRELSPFRVALVTNLEPLYGIIIAYLILGKTEVMTAGFYLGAAIILSAVFIFPLFKKKP